MNFLGIDYGTKRMGLSFADELGVATPLDPIIITSHAMLLDRLTTIVKQRSIDALVIGYPIHMDGNVGKRAQEVNAFINELSELFGLPIHKIDERLTTVQASSDLAAMRMVKKPKNLQARKKQRASGKVDSVAASLILKEFLDQKESF